VKHSVRAIALASIGNALNPITDSVAKQWAVITGEEVSPVDMLRDAAFWASYDNERLGVYP